MQTKPRMYNTFVVQIPTSLVFSLASSRRVVACILEMQLSATTGTAQLPFHICLSSAHYLEGKRRYSSHANVGFVN